MDKNQAIGFVLMAALLMVYFYFFAPKQPEQLPGNMTDTVNTITEAPRQEISPINSGTEQIQKEEPSLTIDSADIKNEKFGPFTSLLTGEENEVTLENDVINISYSSKGGL